MYRLLAVIYAVGLCGGRLHGMDHIDVSQAMRQQVREGFAQFKAQASAMMSQNYVIPRVYVWGGLAVGAGLACFYARQCYSIHTHLFARSAAVDQSIKDENNISHKDFNRWYRQCSGMQQKINLLAKHPSVIDSQSKVQTFRGFVAKLRSRDSETEMVSKVDLIDQYETLAVLSSLLNKVVFSTQRTLDCIRRY